MEASNMESTASIQEREQREREERERAAEGGVPEQSGANDQNRKESDPADQPPTAPAKDLPPQP